MKDERKGIFEGVFYKSTEEIGSNPWIVSRFGKFHACLIVLNLFIGGFHNFIGDFLVLLAKKQIYWRIHPTSWRKTDFIGELEISVVFSHFRVGN
jgi:hypothetical protein